MGPARDSPAHRSPRPRSPDRTDIVATATAKQPADRYEAVYYLRDDLRALYESL